MMEGDKLHVESIKDFKSIGKKAMKKELTFAGILRGTILATVMTVL